MATKLRIILVGIVSILSAVSTAQEDNGEKIVLPLFELKSMIETYTIGKYVPAIPDSAVSDEVLQASKQKWEAHKAGGGTLWSSENWMKPKEYYHGLGTVELTEETFARAIYFELSIYRDPRMGIVRLEAMHEGFAELAGREDLGEGMLRYLRGSGEVIRFGQPTEEIVQRSSMVEALCQLSIIHPGFRSQVKGREREFVAVQAELVKAYIRYLNETIGMDRDEVGLFYREPVYVIETALTLIHADNPEAYQAIFEKLEPRRLGRNQDREELRAFLRDAVKEIEEGYLREE